MDHLTRDLRYAFRILAKRPLSTLIAIFCLAVGIGCNATVFSVVYSVLIKPLPFPDPGQLVVVWDASEAQQQSESPMSAANFVDVRDGNTVFEDMTAWYYNSYTLTGVQEPEELTALSVTAGFFDVLGAEAHSGRTFTEGEDAAGRGRVAVLSHGLWQRRFGGRESILGSTISLDQAPVEVVGVMPPGFGIPSDSVQLWVTGPLNTRANRAVRMLQAFARLKPGLTIVQAQPNLDDLSAQLEEGFPAANRGWRMRMVPLHEQMVGATRTPLLLLFAAVGAILLLACVNVAILLLSRAGTRVREVALRTALGASPSRLLRQLLTESLVLSLIGALAGVVIAFLMLPLLLSLAPGSIPRLDEASIDGLVLAFTLGVSLISGLLFGTAPALEALRRHPGDWLKETSGRESSDGLTGVRLRGLLVIAEVALTVLLLVGAGLLMHSFYNLRTVDPGFRKQGIVVARIFLDGRSYPTPAKRTQYYDQLLTRLKALPGVESAGAVTALPMSPISINYDLPYRIPGRIQPPAGEEPQSDFRVSTPGYHETMGIRLLRGRLFDSRDRGDSQPVVIINQSMAELVWPGQDPVGQQLQIPYSNWASRQVVGVVADTLFYGLASRPKPEMFLPHAQVSMGGLHVAVRVSGQAEHLAPAVRRTVSELDPSQPVHSLTSIEELLAADVASERFLITLLATLSLAALLLAAAGIYGIVSHSVSVRTREFGIRLALGSSTTGLRRMVLGRAFVQIAAGMALGLSAAALATRLVASLLFDTSRFDPITYAAVALFLGLTALAAVYIPARQASRLDPVQALRCE